MKNLLITIVSFFAVLNVAAQQEPAITQFWNTYQHFNPAMTGLEYRHTASALYHHQWARLSYTPRTLMVNYAAKVKRIHGGAGVTYSYDQIGFNDQHTALAHYAFHLPVKNSTLSLGVAMGTATMSSSPEWFAPSTQNDPSLPWGSTSTAFTMHSGLVFHAPNWNAGFSVTNLTAPSMRMKSVSGTGTTSYDFARHYYLFADYNYAFGEKCSLRPRVQAVTDGVFYSVTGSVMVAVGNFWTGVNGRNRDMIGLMAGYDIKGKYRIGYGYDLSYSRLNNGKIGGTHEIVLSYLLK